MKVDIKTQETETLWVTRFVNDECNAAKTLQQKELATAQLQFLIQQTSQKDHLSGKTTMLPCNTMHFAQK